MQINGAGFCFNSHLLIIIIIKIGVRNLGVLGCPSVSVKKRVKVSEQNLFRTSNLIQFYVNKPSSAKLHSAKCEHFS